MNLPIILDVTLGLMFIYLVLSWLASEVQELLTTVFQWRAKHLKKAIEVLLAGGSQGVDDEEEFNRAANLANHLYNDPLINTLNQESRGLVESFLRRLTSPFHHLNGKPFKKKNSGPSYIPSETFATTILETLKIPALTNELMGVKLKLFSDEKLETNIQNLLKQVREIDETTLLQKQEETEASGENSTKIKTNLMLLHSFYEFKDKIKAIIKDLKEGKATLVASIDRIEERLERYIQCANSLLENESSSRQLIDQLKLLKQDFFGSTPERIKAEKELLITSLKPNLTEIVATYQEAIQAHRIIQATQDAKEKITAESNTSYKLIKHIHKDVEENVNNLLPKPVLDSLDVLAKRAQSKTQASEDEANQLRQEIELWFNRSMERSSGVYKRNAKGVAIILGFLIAYATNTDTFHMVSRLSTDSVLRSTIIQKAEQLVLPNAQATDEQLQAVQEKFKQTLVDMSLPIGWSPSNVQQQREESRGWFYPPLKKFLGWMISGVAISMGATFWFDLLGKIINVRNSGKPPEPPATNQPTTPATHQP